MRLRPSDTSRGNSVEARTMGCYRFGRVSL